MKQLHMYPYIHIILNIIYMYDYHRDFTGVDFPTTTTTITKKVSMTRSERSVTWKQQECRNIAVVGGGWGVG